MVTYIITSTLLSLMGMAVYLLLVRRHASSVQQKVFIYLVVASSLLLPLTGHKIIAEKPHATTAFGSALTFGQYDLHEENLKNYCQCENPNYSHRIRYQTNVYINFLVENKAWLGYVILFAFGLGVIKIAAQYGYLFFLQRNSRKELFAYKGKTFTLLHTEKPHAIGAFQLGAPYIIWQKEMDQLSEPEIHAIIQHELSHLQQRNTLEKSILNLIQCVWLLNPVFYFFRQELDLISECIADREGVQAIGNKKAYAHLLIRLKELQAIPIVSHFKGSNLNTRIQYLLSDPRPGNWALYLGTLALVISLHVGVVGTLSAQVDETLDNLGTYEEIYLENPKEDHLFYCPDCSSVCVPVVEFNPCY